MRTARDSWSAAAHGKPHLRSQPAACCPLQDGTDPALAGHAGTVRAFLAAGGGVLVAASSPSPWNSVPAITGHPANLLMAPLGISVATAAQQMEFNVTATLPSQAAANAEAQIDCLVAVVRPHGAC